MPYPIKRVTVSTTEYFDGAEVDLDEELDGENLDDEKDDEDVSEPAAPSQRRRK